MHGVEYMYMHLTRHGMFIKASRKEKDIVRIFQNGGFQVDLDTNRIYFFFSTLKDTNSLSVAHLSHLKFNKKAIKYIHFYSSVCKVKKKPLL